MIKSAQTVKFVTTCKLQVVTFSAPQKPTKLVGFLKGITRETVGINIIWFDNQRFKACDIGCAHFKSTNNALSVCAAQNNPTIMQQFKHSIISRM